MKRAISILLTLILAISMLSGIVVFADNGIDEYVNVVGGSLTFQNDAYYPWNYDSISIGKYGISSGNAGIASSSSKISTTATFGENEGIMFTWKCSSQLHWDYFSFEIDGVEITRISGVYNPETRTFALQPGEHTLSWTYHKDEAYNSYDDKGYLDEIAIVRVTGTEHNIDAALNSRSSDFKFENCYNEPWQAVTHSSGITAGKSGNSGKADTSSVITLNETLEAGKILNFNWAVESEKNCDFFTFEVNGETVAQISGFESFTTYHYTIEETGNYTFRWIYSKDGSGTNVGEDCGYLCQVRVGDTVPVQSVIIMKTGSVAVGATTKIGYTLRPASTTETDVTWESSNPAAATVAADGTITGIGIGTTVIKVTTKAGTSAECTVTVTEYAPAKTYYINPKSGNDNNKGTSTTTAVKTINGAMNLLDKAGGTAKFYIMDSIVIREPINIYAKTINFVAGGSGVSITRAAGYTGTIFNVAMGGKLILGNATAAGLDISIGAGDSKSPSVYIDGGECYLMHGGEISSNKSTASGAGVYLKSGTFSMLGGSISANSSARYGGAVYAAGGNLNIYGGTITSNTAGYYGGGIYINNGTEYDIEESVVSGNTASKKFDEIFYGIPEAAEVFGVEDGATYDIREYPDGVAISWVSPVECTATLNGEAYTAETPIVTNGDYTFKLDDGFNPIQYSFSVYVPTAPVVSGIGDGEVVVLANTPEGAAITWESAEECTATLNGEAYVAGTAITEVGDYTFEVTDGYNTIVYKFEIILADPYFGYGFIAFSESESRGWARIDAYCENEIKFDGGDMADAVAADAVGSKVYGYTEEGKAFIIDMARRLADGETLFGTATYGATIEEYTPLDVAYDYASGRLYVLLAKGEDERYLGVASLEDGSVSDIIPFATSEKFIAIACNTVGDFYALEAGENATFYKLIINSEDVTAEKFLETGVPSYYLQSIAFGEDDGKLFWMQCDEETSAAYLIDVAEKSIIKIADLDNNEEIVGLFFTDRINTEEIHTSENGMYKYTRFADGGIEIVGYNWKNTNQESYFPIFSAEDGSYLVEIPERIDGLTVRSIGKYAFGYRGDTYMPIGKVVLPKTVESVGYGAFRANAKLTEVQLANVTVIGDYAFYQCSALAAITIPETVETVGYGAFMECSAFAEATVYAKDITFGDYVFYNTAEGFKLIGYWPGDVYDFAKAKGITFEDLIPYEEPTVEGVEDGGKYYLSNTPEGVAITWEAMVEATVTLNGEAYEAGTAVAEIGNYTFVISDGRTEKTLTFSIFETERAMGDLDGDEQITVTDALAVLRFAAKLAVPTELEKKIADVDGDGEVTVTDALAVLRVAAKLAEPNTLGVHYQDPPNVTPEV